jgi:hypothetical protein
VESTDFVRVGGGGAAVVCVGSKNYFLLIAAIGEKTTDTDMHTYSNINMNAYFSPYIYFLHINTGIVVFAESVSRNYQSEFTMR